VNPQRRWSMTLPLKQMPATLQSTIQNLVTAVRDAGHTRLSVMARAELLVLLAIAVFMAAGPEKTGVQKLPELAADASVAPANTAVGCSAATDRSQAAAGCRGTESTPEPLIVIGFMGGRVGADNLVHKEALLARNLDRLYPNAIYAATFANRHESDALRTVLHLLGAGKNGYLSAEQKGAARIVIYGHSWGGSETVNFARALDRLGIPVLLTIQVDSVTKSGEDDRTIPANVRDAINFYQTDGLLHGRSSIQAANPQRTTIMGNFESTYKSHPVSCAGFSWYARAFMKPHIEIENDGAVWDRVEALIVARLHASS
jgi:hypothetical protein